MGLIQLSTTTPTDTEPTVAEKGEEENQTVEVVTEVIVQRSLINETKMFRAINDDHLMPKNKEVIMTNVRCNDFDFLSKKDEFDMVFNHSSSAKSIDTELIGTILVGNSIEVSNINANSIKATELECNQTSMIPTLAASIQNMHMPTNLNDEARGSTAKINDHLNSIRTWKRLMRQVNLARAENKCDEKIKRTLSTCMVTPIDSPSKRLQVMKINPSLDLMVEAIKQPYQELRVS